MAITLNGTTGVTTTGLTSNGIDDNATSTAITIDTSGNLLVGKTSNAFGTAGVALSPSGSNNMTRAGDPPLALNRLTSDGDILGFYKDGSTVGSIGTLFGDLYVATGNTGIRCVDANRSISAYDSNANGLVDAAVDLGFDTTRFKDLYLSGGVYLGGTGAANKLDDYEEGTFTPTFTPDTSGSLPLQSNYDTMQYVKIGNWVTLSGFIRAATPSSPVGSFPTLGNFPFTVANLADSAGRSSGSVSYFDDSAGNWSVLPCYIVESQTQAYLSIDSSTIGNNDGFYISFNYRTT